MKTNIYLSTEAKSSGGGFQYVQYNALPEVVSTSQAAKVLNRAEQTLRRWACQENAPSGIRPIRINRRLAWRVSDLNLLLVGGETGHE